MDAHDVDVRPGLPARLAKVFAYMAIALAVSWRGLAYESEQDPSPLVPVFMCALMVVVLYLLSVATLVRQAEVGPS